jgi:hypothetical protein
MSTTTQQKTIPYSELSKSVWEVVEQPQRVFLSIYDTVETKIDEDGEEYEMVSCPDVYSKDPVIAGDCKFSINDDRFSPELLISPIYTDPTWSDILNCCNDLLSMCPEKPNGFLYDIIPGSEGVYEFMFA